MVCPNNCDHGKSELVLRVLNDGPRMICILCGFRKLVK